MKKEIFICIFPAILMMAGMLFMIILPARGAESMHGFVAIRYEGPFFEVGEVAWAPTVLVNLALWGSIPAIFMAAKRVIQQLNTAA